MIEVIPATRELLDRLLGDDPRPRIRAFVALLDGEPVGVAGIAYRGDKLEVFSNLRPEMMGHRLTIYRTARKIVAFLAQDWRTAYALPQADIPGAVRFLERLGFEPEGELMSYRRN